MDEQAVAWLRRQIEVRRGLARRTVELGNLAEWTEQSSGVLITSEPADDDIWRGTQPMGDSSLAGLMEANDPQDTFARCEAELAIVDLCARVIREDEGHGYWSDGWAGLGVARMVLGGIAAAYRHRPGYADHWPAAAATPGSLPAAEG